MTDSSTNPAPQADTNIDKTTPQPVDAMKAALEKFPEHSRQKQFFTQLAKNTISDDPEEKDVAQAAVDYFARMSALPPIELADGKPTTKSVVQFLNLIRPEDRQAMQEISGMGITRRGLLGGGVLAIGALLTAGGVGIRAGDAMHPETGERQPVTKETRAATRDLATFALVGGAITSALGLSVVIAEMRQAHNELDGNRDNMGAMVQNAETLITENEKLLRHLNELKASMNKGVAPGV